MTDELNIPPSPIPMAGIQPMSAQYIRTQIEIVQAAMTALFATPDPTYDEVIKGLTVLADQLYNTKLSYVQLLAIPPGETYPRMEGPRIKVDPAEHYTKDIHREGRRLRKKHGTLFSFEAITCGYQYLGTELFITPRDYIDRVLSNMDTRKPGRPVSPSTPIKNIILSGIKKTIVHHQNEIVRLANMRTGLLAELAECGEDIEKLTAFCSKYNLR